MNLWQRIKLLVVQRVLGVHDTPHRIAWGVGLGVFIACTPTVGLHTIILLALATLLRANKVSGLAAAWISNPVTAVPIYYTTWWIGAHLMQRDASPERGRLILHTLGGTEVGWQWGRLLESGFWWELVSTLWSLGAELWVGGAVVGIVAGAFAYGGAYWGVQAYRRARGG